MVKMEITAYQNLWDAAKAMFRMTFIALTDCIWRGESFKISYLNFYLKKIERRSNQNQNIRIKKKRKNGNQQNTKITNRRENHHWNKSWFFTKIIIIGKLLTRFKKREIERQKQRQTNFHLFYISLSYFAHGLSILKRLLHIRYISCLSCLFRIFSPNFQLPLLMGNYWHIIFLYILCSQIYQSFNESKMWEKVRNLYTKFKENFHFSSSVCISFIIFSSLINFEYNLKYSVRYESNFILFPMATHLSQL